MNEKDSSAPGPETPGPDSKIVVDEDWKSQVQAEKETQDTQQPDAGAEEQVQIPDASFPMLVTTLATQAAVALGQTAAPDAPEAMVDLALAKHIIDTLGVLEEKTQGNLSTDESGLLTSILHQLRMTFLAVQGQLSSQPPPEPEKKSSIELP